MKKSKALPELGLSLLLGVDQNSAFSPEPVNDQYQMVKGKLRISDDDIFFVDESGFSYEITDRSHDGVYRYNFFDQKSNPLTSKSFTNNEPVMATFLVPHAGFSLHDEMAVKIAKI
jgi:hypothetical protein